VEFFIDRMRSNLHIVLAMSPIGDGFRNRCRKYPSLASCTTIDWFHDWPGVALQEVASKFLEEVKLEKTAELSEAQMKAAIAEAFAYTHMSVTEASVKMLEELKRRNYVTPTNYLELVKGYRTLLEEKRKELRDSIKKLQNGLEKLTESKDQVAVMSAALVIKQETVSQSQKECEGLLVVIVSERRVADEQKKVVEAESEKIAKEAAKCDKIAADAQADLDVALPALERAMAEVDKLEKSSITELKSFTLEAVFSLGSHLHAEFIGEMSSNANKEREDDQVAVSTMKASRFYAAFKGSIDKWEHILSHISKVIEVLLTVQRQWMYLESIFMASEDIRKQLPTEAIIFEDMNNKI
jgi:hypothetical protein